MSNYRTTIKVQKAPFSLKWGEPVCLLGSCFSENIGAKLESAGFPVLKNPFGIQYNPASMAILLRRIEKQKPYQLEDLHKHKGLHFSFETHSDWAETSAEACVEKLNAALENAEAFLTRSSTVILTVGTAWYYRHLQSRQTVANCFKIPSTAFEKKLLDINAAEDALHQCLVSLRFINPELNIILTLSPVRHWKDGVQENAVSKAILRLALNDACGNERVAYFGAYEIMMDDLRDYRFYKADMLHPNEVAIDYIWEHFCETYLDKKDRDLVDRTLQLDQASKHKPRNAEGEAHQNFLKQQLQEVAALQKLKALPKLDQLKQYFESHLI
jgi:hypothetical protein